MAIDIVANLEFKFREELIFFSPLFLLFLFYFSLPLFDSCTTRNRKSPFVEPNGPARSKVAQPKRTDGNTHLSQTLSLSSHPHPSASRPSGRRRRPPPPPSPPSSVLIAWTSASTAAAGALLHLPLIVDFPPSRSKHAASCLSLRRRRPSKRQMRHCRQSS